MRDDVAAVRRVLAALPDRYSQPIAERRAGLDAFGARSSPPADVRIERTLLNGVPAERMQAADAESGGTLLFLHGGAYVAGSLASHRAFGAFLALESGAAVFTLDYALAPERPFPAGLENAVSACAALSEKTPEASCFAIAGDSAGGGLAVATALALRDRGLPQACAVACMSPWLDLTCESKSHTERGLCDPFLTTAGLKQDAVSYLNGTDPYDPLVSPLFADLAGLPPLLLQVGSDEILLEDATRMEARAHAAGVSARLEVWPEMFHVWHAFRGLLPEAAQATSAVAHFLCSHFEWATAGPPDRA